MNNEEWYVILNMNCKYEICRMGPKSGLFKGSYEECEKWIEQKQKEDMKDVEYFRKNYPDFCYGDKPLSPYWDFFQDGVEFGERQSEKKIEELEGRLKEHESVGNAQFWENVWLWKSKAEQLTKAKVALQNVIDYLGQFCSDYPDCVIEAEQFLNKE